jgi:RNA polymerase sigma factor (sigma-70 family)
VEGTTATTGATYDLSTEAEFRRFYDEHRPFVYGEARRRGANHHDAEEIVQETMLRCCQLRESLTDDGRTRGFVRVVARNIHMDLLRRSRRLVVWEPLAFEAHVDSYAACPAASAAFTDTITRLGVGLAELLPNQRWLIVASASGEFSDRELAAIARVTENNLRQRRYHARRRLETLSGVGSQTEAGAAVGAAPASPASRVNVA